MTLHNIFYIVIAALIISLIICYWDRLIFTYFNPYDRKCKLCGRGWNMYKYTVSGNCKWEEMYKEKDKHCFCEFISNLFI